MQLRPTEAIRVPKMPRIEKPELLCPAGDRERLETVIAYGADAVYLGLTQFTMRAAPGNFDIEGLADAVKYSHEHGVKVYVTFNTLPHENELVSLYDSLEKAGRTGADAFIITDLGVMAAAKRLCPQTEIHISTQFGLTNSGACTQLFEMGAKRAVLARELSLEQIKQIRKNTPAELELECFVHGAMCVSFSGRCLLSSYLTERDSNRGNCAQPCRWNYYLTEQTRPGMDFEIQQDTHGTYIMNSKDMCMIEHLKELSDAGVSSFKIEGRAKSVYYAACVTHAYRTAVDDAVNGRELSQWANDEVYKMSYRQYCTGFYYDDPAMNANVSYKGGYERNWEVIADVLSCRDGRMYLAERNPFSEGDTLEVLAPGTPPYELKITDLRSDDGLPLCCTKQAMAHVSVKCDDVLPEHSMLRGICRR